MIDGKNFLEIHSEKYLLFRWEYGIMEKIYTKQKKSTFLTLYREFAPLAESVTNERGGKCVFAMRVHIRERTG